MAAEDYVGPVGHEKKFHKTHFHVTWNRKRTHPKDDPNWEEFAPGRWRLKRKKETNGNKEKES